MPYKIFHIVNFFHQSFPSGGHYFVYWRAKYIKTLSLLRKEAPISTQLELFIIVSVSSKTLITFDFSLLRVSVHKDVRLKLSKGALK